MELRRRAALCLSLMIGEAGSAWGRCWARLAASMGLYWRFWMMNAALHRHGQTECAGGQLCLSLTRGMAGSAWRRPLGQTHVSGMLLEGCLGTLATDAALAEALPDSGAVEGSSLPCLGERCCGVCIGRMSAGHAMRMQAPGLAAGHGAVALQKSSTLMTVLVLHEPARTSQLGIAVSATGQHTWFAMGSCHQRLMAVWGVQSMQ